jgi:glyoxylase-like metal-dependent hydrolase (beta-lactamase superfamily II)
MNSHITALTLTMISNGEQKPIHPTLIWDKEEVILVDTGVPGQLHSIRNEMNKLGIPFSRLTKIILTHHDLDHIGSLPEILEASEQKISVLAHPLAKPYIEGEKRLIKLKDLNVEPPKAMVDRTIEDDELIAECGGIKVIFSPGHTPDHISLYHIESKTLIAGDATIAVQGELKGPNPQYTLEMKEAYQSIGKLLSYEVDQVICYHGGICKGTEMLRLEELYYLNFN